jgi:hypothetical protein
MKKFLVIVFALTLCLFAISFEKHSVSANADTYGDLVSSETEYFNDGSYLVTNHYEVNRTLNTRSNVRNVLHTVTATQYSATNKVLWIYELTGGWYVEDGVSVVAMSSVMDITLESNAWQFHDGESTYYDNIVHGGGYFEHKLLGITTKKVIIDFNLICDVYGNVTRLQ